MPKPGALGFPEIGGLSNYSGVDFQIVSVSWNDTAEDTLPRRTLNKGIALKHLVLREGRGWVIPD